MNILNDRDIINLTEMRIMRNELKEANKLISFILSRSSKKPNLLVLRASIQLRFGKYNLQFATSKSKKRIKRLAISRVNSEQVERKSEEENYRINITTKDMVSSLLKR